MLFSIRVLSVFGSLAFFAVLNRVAYVIYPRLTQRVNRYLSTKQP
jgi:hypothetical protein